MLHEVTHAKSRSEMITELLIFALNILVSTFSLRLVWNRSLSKHISVLKPISSLLDAFILSISLQVIRGV